MKIPKRFKLFGRTFTVEYDEQLDRIKKCMGEALFEEHKIFLQPITETNGRKKEAVEEVFMHELLHMCFSIMGKEEISANEAIITTLAGLLHQALTTAEHEELSSIDIKGGYDKCNDAQWIIDHLKRVPKDILNDTLTLSSDLIQDIVERLERMGGKV